jgi:hypothetical protein
MKIIMSYASVLLSLSCVVFGQDAVSVKSLKNYEMPSDMQQYFQNKYSKQVERVGCNFHGTPYGPKGYLSVVGHLVIKNQNDIIGRGDQRIRSIAKSFLADEAAVLGLSDLNEWHEEDLRYDRTNTGRLNAAISYIRYIGDFQFSSGAGAVSIHLQIDDDDTIHSLSAHLAPALPEVYKAVSNKTISKEDAEKIIQHDLQKQGMASLKIQLALYATDVAPYIVWGAYSTNGVFVWNYTINAITGELYHKYKGRLNDPGC